MTPENSFNQKLKGRQSASKVMCEVTSSMRKPPLTAGVAFLNDD
jgi:hypothetical protein